MKTKDRILLTSLKLFNEQGERNVSTNHIAAYLNISPGNLYYHFRNKNEIVYQLFLQYQAEVQSFMTLPQAAALAISMPSSVSCPPASASACFWSTTRFSTTSLVTWAFFFLTDFHAAVYSSMGARVSMLPKSRLILPCHKAPRAQR